MACALSSRLPIFYEKQVSTTERKGAFDHDTLDLLSFQSKHKARQTEQDSNGICIDLISGKAIWGVHYEISLRNVAQRFRCADQSYLFAKYDDALFISSCLRLTNLY